MRTWSLFAALAALALGAPARSPAAEPACRARLSGAITATFRCSVEARDLADDLVGLTINALEPAGDATSVAPGGFQIPAPLTARTYLLGDLGPSRASIIAKDGTLYSATRTSSMRGEVTLALRSVKPQPKAQGRYAVHGTLHAVLTPSGSPKEDVVVVDVEF